MKKVFKERLVAALFLLLLSSIVQADGVAIPKVGGFLVLNGNSLTEVRTVEMGGEDVPKLAVHPSSAVMAGMSADKLTFWNLPSFAEASRHSEPIFAAVTDLAFSADGSTLYLLSGELRAVIKFDLATSRVSGTLPVPGGEPLWLKAHAKGVVVGQENSVSLLSATAEEGLLSQFRFPEKISSALVREERLYLTRAGVAGIDSYEVQSGRAIGFLPTANPLSRLVGGVTDGLYALSQNGEVQAWTVDAAQPRWTIQSGGVAFDELVTGGDGSTVFAYAEASQTLVSLDTALGKENARVNLGASFRRSPVVFSASF